MAALYLMGKGYESYFGWEQLGECYLIGGVTGALVGYYFNIIRHSPFNYLLGASAAIYAIVGNFIMYFPTMPLYLYGIIKIPAWMVGLGMGTHGLYNFNSFGGGISHAGHMGGFLGGILFYFFKEYGVDWYNRVVKGY